MNTNKTAYWIAATVLAFGLTSEYRQGGFPEVHQVAGRAESLLCRIVASSERALAFVRVAAIRERLLADELVLEARSAKVGWNPSIVLREEVRGHSELFRDQMRARAELMRARTEIQRVQWQQVQQCARSQMRMAHMENQRDLIEMPDMKMKNRKSIV